MDTASESMWSCHRCRIIGNVLNQTEEIVPASDVSAKMFKSKLTQKFFSRFPAESANKNTSAALSFLKSYICKVFRLFWLNVSAKGR